MPQKARDVESALKSKGFQEARKRDHKYFFFYHKGKKTNICTKISHGEREIHDQNCGAMAKQIKLTKGQFEQFTECALTAEKYVELLTSANHLKPDQSK